MACTLDHDQAVDQLGEWAALVESASAVDRRDGRLSATLPISWRARIEDLAVRERSCCSFLAIDIVADTAAGTVTVTVASPEPAADKVVSFIGRRV
jgi:hypothetical protein